MKYTQFLNELVVGLYRMSDDEPGMIPFSSVVDHYQIKYRPGWLLEAQNDLRADNLLNGPASSRNDEMAIGKLTGAGLRRAEELIDDPAMEESIMVFEVIDDSKPGEDEANDFDFLATEDGDAIVTEDGDQIVAEDRSSVAQEAPITADSSTWTGKKLVLVDQKVIQELRVQAEALRDRIHSTHFDSNRDSNDLKSLADALVNISNMAEPDLTIIDRILAHPKFQVTATLMAAVATIRGALGI